MGDGFCDDILNNKDCEYDRGDCCECTCVDGPIYTCGMNGLQCEDPTCLDPNLLAEFPDCGGNLLRVDDGACNAYNNNEECGYDGGDCCLCTCIKNEKCGFGDFDCLDPSAEEGLYQCQPPLPGAPCAVETQRTWMVEDSTQAEALAQTVNCSGGTFDVLWKGFVTLERTIYVASGSVMTITGVGEPSTAVIDGGLQTQILTAVDASLHVINVTFSLGSSVFGGAIVASASSMTFTRTSFVGNMASVMGGAIYMENQSTAWFDMETSLLRNSAVGFGGALYACGNSSVTFTVEEAYILHNAAGENGGAIAIDQSHIWWSGKTFYNNNTSGYYGGVVDVSNGSTVRWFGSHFFSENTAAWGGGALAVHLKSHVWWSGDMVFEYNRASFLGGAIYVVNGGDISWDGSTIFTSNIASNAGGALSAILGADVSWSGDTVFKDNRASFLGGAIYVVNGGDISWDGSTIFTSNIALYAGGALSANLGADVSWSGDTVFKDNRASILGGAIYVDNGGDISWDGSTIFTSNIALYAGGALSVVSGADVSWSGDTVFKNNRATSPGGAIYIESAEVSWSGVSSFSHNSAKVGGAISATSSSFVRWNASNTIFILNMATSAGGGAVAIGNSTISWTGSTAFESNQANTVGGAIFASDVALSWSGDTIFECNRAAYGGAAHLIGSRVTWDGNTEFVSNTASGLNTSGAGALVASRVNGSWRGVTLFYNNSAMTAGAVYIENSSNVEWIGKTLFLNNSAALFGGGVVAWKDTNVNWRGDTMFVSNNAILGGAVYIGEGVRAKLTGQTTFTSNEAGEQGGAVAALVASTDDDLIPFLLIEGITEFVDNVSGRDGGAISLVGGVLVEIEPTAKVSFRRNYARVSGGAIFMSGANVGPIFRGVSFVSNSAQFGGGVHATSSGNAKIDLKGKETFNPTTFDQCIFVNNTAIATGGAIQSAAGQDCIISTSFIGNTARAGGALFLAGTTNFFNCSFFDNVAEEGDGPAISNIGYVESMKNSTFVGNAYNCAAGTFRAFDSVRSAFDYYTCCVSNILLVYLCDLAGTTLCCLEFA